MIYRYTDHRFFGIVFQSNSSFGEENSKFGIKLQDALEVWENRDNYTNITYKLSKHLEDIWLLRIIGNAGSFEHTYWINPKYLKDNKNCLLAYVE